MTNLSTVVFFICSIISRKSVTTDNSDSATETRRYVHRVLRSNCLHHHLPPYCSHCQHAQLPDIVVDEELMTTDPYPMMLTHMLCITVSRAVREYSSTVRINSEGWNLKLQSPVLTRLPTTTCNRESELSNVMQKRHSLSSNWRY